MKFRNSTSRSLLCIEPKVGGRLFESFAAEGTEQVIEVGRVRTLVTVTHSGLSTLPADHPARHGLQGSEFLA